MSNNEFRNIALSFPGVIEAPHFERAAFKVVDKRIFATLLKETSSANIKFSPEQQKAFCEFDPKIIYPVANKWGQQGWTTIELAAAPEELVFEALETAYKEVFIKKKK